MPDPATEPIEQELNKPEIPEVAATRKDVVEGPSLAVDIQHFFEQLQKQGIWLTFVESLEQTIRLITGAPTLHFSRIQPSLHIGGQFLGRGWPILTRRGITAVVSMRQEFDDREAGIAPPHYLYLPTEDNHAPTLEQLEQGVEFIRQEIASGGKVYVHCWEGVGRAPTMAAAYLISTGMTSKEAWDTIARVRPFIRPLQPQLDQIERFAATQIPAVKRSVP